MPNYGDATYWDDRYTQQKNTTFDWLESWNDIKDIIEKHAVQGFYEVSGNPCDDEDSMKVRAKTKVLNLGCGNSILVEDMYDEGYKQVWNMDISEVCIHQMHNRNLKARPELKWDVMDCRDLKYEDNFFDLIVDKSTIDALLCGSFAMFNVAVMLKEC